jgi:GrpB-like predicted nucleotidyltransferase (UPF0157 family)
MKILKYKKIDVSFTAWCPTYFDIAEDVIDFIQSDIFEVIHIGSTSFKVGGKGIIDLTLLYKNNDLHQATKHLSALGFQDQLGKKPFPPERPRKDGAVNVNGKEYYLHVHVISSGSDEHKKQLQYKNYMLNDLVARNKYESHKKEILSNGFTDQETYGEQKSPFVKSLLKGVK